MSEVVAAMRAFVAMVDRRDEQLSGGGDGSAQSNDYAWEFLRIRVENEELRHEPAFQCGVGQRPENARKNRYADIIPYDYSRVPIGADGAYINASFINGSSGKVAYVAAQGPVRESVADFWQMVVEYGVRVVVMLSHENETAKSCEPYWPSVGCTAQFGAIQVVGLCVDQSDADFCMRSFSVQQRESVGGRRRNAMQVVRQLHFGSFADHGRPQRLDGLLRMLDEVRRVQPFDSAPVLVHCSAGVGRTGTVCAVDIVKSRLSRGTLTNPLNVYGLVMELRRQRVAMVQSVEQYILLHHAIRLIFLRQLEAIENHVYENLPFQENNAPSAAPIRPPRTKHLRRRTQQLEDSRNDQKGLSQHTV